ncbi:protein fem-1 homolog A-like [Epargyreus clarus]|uniref:protein fem-1 homolog A-like n=1 Tax=Epargyreus clarus TaxID=520877 RepID=UPI003C2AB439
MSSTSDEMDDDAKSTETKYHDAVFAELMSECKNNDPDARLSNGLRQKLESMRPGERRALVGRTRDGCAPLLVAARRGNAEAVDYLVHVCAAELEQRGVYEVAEDRSRHAVTPLWVAAVAGRARALRVLLEAGAQVDAPSDTGSTPLRSACFVSHVEVAELLLRGGADVNRANHNGGTCLINAVQSPRLCALLLRAGAAVDARDAQLKTALHYAVQEHRLETARLLLQHGADPLLRSAAGDDALRIACTKGAGQIMKMLLSRGTYPLWRVADAYELLGATQLDEFNDVSAALVSWRQATALRHSTEQYEEKRFADEAEEAEAGAALARLRAGAAAALGGAREWRSVRELDAAAADAALLRAQALLVAARVLGATHKDVIFRFMYRGAAYADSFQYQRCIELWTWALEARLTRDSVLCPEAVQTASALARLLLDAEGGRLARARGLPRFADAARALELLAAALLRAQALLLLRPHSRPQVPHTLTGYSEAAALRRRGARAGAARRRAAARAGAAAAAPAQPPAGTAHPHRIQYRTPSQDTVRLPRFADAARALELLAAALLRAQALLLLRPHSRPQLECMDGAVRCFMHVLAACAAAARGAAARRRLARAVRRVLAADVRAAAGDSLLHLAAARLDPVASTYFADDDAAPMESVFPSASVARLLLRCGADAARLNDARCTPLHVATLPYNFCNEVVEVLLEAGAHLDQPNAFGDSALEQLAQCAASRVRPLRHVSLACLCARALAARRPPPAALLPRALHELLRRHRPARRQPPPAPPAAADTAAA